MAVDPSDTWRGMIGIAMILAFVGIFLGIAYLLYGPGVTIKVPTFFKDDTATTTIEIVETSATQPPPLADFLATQEGRLFRCDGGKALKAGFVGANVRLALSDGRILTLPQTVTQSGEVRYTNSDESFALLNTGNTVSVKEGVVATYSNCNTALQ